MLHVSISILGEIIISLITCLLVAKYLVKIEMQKVYINSINY